MTIRQSVPWRLQRLRLVGVGALSPAQVEELARRFDLDQANLRRLSESLGRALDPDETPHLIGITRDKARERAAIGHLEKPMVLSRLT